MIRKLLASAVVVALGGVAFAADFKSGPQTGEAVPGAFNVLNVTGPTPGESNCQFCKNGNNPVVMIFARTPGDPALQKLIKQVDEKIAANKDARIGSFVVYLTADSKKIEPEIKGFADKQGIKNVVLTTDTPTGPEAYKIAKDADVTVVLYTKRNVKANYTFEKGKMTDKDVEKVLADLPKIAG
ncbi:MAG: hypothetical protein K2P78_08455 [Gemmataceae bacterium]|nr:hypothetical protein [Gemmataceae bacterium]